MKSDLSQGVLWLTRQVAWCSGTGRTPKDWCRFLNGLCFNSHLWSSISGNDQSWWRSGSAAVYDFAGAGTGPRVGILNKNRTRIRSEIFSFYGSRIKPFIKLKFSLTYRQRISNLFYIFGFCQSFWYSQSWYTSS